MRFENYIDDIRYTILLSYIYEGVYDPSIFKAIFLAGGPGSGKSFVASQTTSGQGFKLVNSDILFTKMAKDSGVNLANMSFDENDPEVRLRNAVRDRAKKLTDKQLEGYVRGRLGVVIDGTGRDYTKIKSQKDKLASLGYDTYMIFVNTSLEVALERNAKRERNVDPDFVEKSWRDVQGNMGKFQTLFGSDNFKIIDNNVYTDDKTVFNMAWKQVMKFARKPLKNRIAQEWISQALLNKQR